MAASVEGDDASGNWGLGAVPGTVTNGWNLHQAWTGLDPRYVWKLEVDFSPSSQFTPETLLTLDVPVSLPQPILTNFGDVPLEVKWVNQNMLSVQMLTNRPDLRLFFVDASDGEGRSLDDRSGSWGQASFWRALNLERTNQSVKATVPVVPNVHVTYYVQPKLIEARR